MKVNLTSPSYVIGYTVVLSALFTAGIMTLDWATASAVRRQQELLRRRALVEILLTGPGAPAEGRKPAQMPADQINVLYEDHVVAGRLRDPASGRETELLTAYARDVRTGRPGEDNAVLGYAFPVEGVGFWATVRGYLAVSPDGVRALGITFLEHAETPGLGGRITEKAFRDQFIGLNLSPQAGKRFLTIGRDRPRDPADPRYGRYVDAITGATGTSLAVEKFLNADLARFRDAAAAAGLFAAPAETKPTGKGPGV
jgi:Na+-transporting NADH:ubiquinone oxidoreductase subunit C